MGDYSPVLPSTEHPVNVYLTGKVFAGAPLILGCAKALLPGDVIQLWQVEWLETLGHRSVQICNN